MAGIFDTGISKAIRDEHRVVRPTITDEKFRDAVRDMQNAPDPFPLRTPTIGELAQRRAQAQTRLEWARQAEHAAMVLYDEEGGADRLRRASEYVKIQQRVLIDVTERLMSELVVKHPL